MIVDSCSSSPVTFARVRYASAKAAESAVAKIKLHCKAKITHVRSQSKGTFDGRLGFLGLSVCAPLLFHAVRIHDSKKYDRLEPYGIIDTKPFSERRLRESVSWMCVSRKIDRFLSVEWQFNDGPNFAHTFLAYSLGRESSGFHSSFRTGNIYETPLDYDVSLRVKLTNHIVNRLGVCDRFNEVDLGNGFGVFPTSFKKSIDKKHVLVESNRGLLKIGYHHSAATGIPSFTPGFHRTDISSSAGIAVDDFHTWLSYAQEVLGPPKRIQIRLQSCVEDIPITYPAICELGRVVSYQEFTADYRGKFDPLAPQLVRLGEVNAFPLLIVVTDPDSHYVSLTPLLAVNVVHASDGSWIELQSVRGREWINDTVKILGGKAEYYEGADPAERWGWYTEKLAPLPLPPNDENPPPSSSVSKRTKSTVNKTVETKKKTGINHHVARKAARKKPVESQSKQGAKSGGRVASKVVHKKSSTKKKRPK